MIGQHDLRNKIAFGNIPRTLLLVGEKGSGKHLLINLIAEKLKLDQLDITESISYELISDITLKAEPHLYIINGAELTAKTQNVILKFLEEPLKNAYIVVTCESTSQLLLTVLNRCQVWILKEYTRKELEEYISTTLKLNPSDPPCNCLIQVCKTPGKLNRGACFIDKILTMNDFAIKVLSQINKANFANMLTIPSKINFDKDTAKFDFELFVDLLHYNAAKLYVENSSLRIYKVYEETAKLKKKLRVPHLNKLYAFESYLCSIWSIEESK